MADSESDNFYVNSPGFSGQLVVTPTAIWTIPYREYVYQWTHNYTRWEITTEDGAKYGFGAVDNSTDYSPSGILRKNYVARLCRTLGTLMKAQVSLVEALETSQRVISNAELKDEIKNTTKNIRQEKSVDDPVFASRLFPPMRAQMITVGEETSELDRMLLKVADYYEKDIDGTLESLSNLIEPMIVLFLGFVVAVILISMYLTTVEDIWPRRLGGHMRWRIICSTIGCGRVAEGVGATSSYAWVDFSS